jgi:MraZ protein
MIDLDKSFFGDHEVTLDEAGRIAIPRSFRNKLEKGQAVLTRGVDPCIWLYAVEDWEQRVKEIAGATDPDAAESRYIRRRNFGFTHPVDIDKQGRVLIPPRLREFAGLSKDCMVVGQYDYVEIWDKERFETSACGQEEYYQVAENFASKKEGRELQNVENSSHSGIAGGDHTVSGAAGQE